MCSALSLRPKAGCSVRCALSTQPKAGCYALSTQPKAGCSVRCALSTQPKAVCCVLSTQLRCGAPRSRCVLSAPWVPNSQARNTVPERSEQPQFSVPSHLVAIAIEPSLAKRPRSVRNQLWIYICARHAISGFTRRDGKLLERFFTKKKPACHIGRTPPNRMALPIAHEESWPSAVMHVASGQQPTELHNMTWV